MSRRPVETYTMPDGTVIPVEDYEGDSDDAALAFRVTMGFLALAALVGIVWGATR